MPTPFQNLVSGNFGNYFAATPAGQLISWLGSLGDNQGAVGDPSQFNLGADQDPYNPANFGMAGMNVSITPGGDVTQYFSPSDLAGMSNIFGLSPTNIATTSPFGGNNNIPYSYGTTGAMPGAGSDLTFTQVGQGGVTTFPTYGVGQENAGFITPGTMPQGGNIGVGTDVGQTVTLAPATPTMVAPASSADTGFAQGVVTMPAFRVNESYLMPSTTDTTGTQSANDPFQMSSYIAPSGGGGATVTASTATSTATTSVTPSGQGVTTLPAFNVNETPIGADDLGFGGNLYQPFSGQLPGTITPGAGGVGTLNIAPQPTSTSTVSTTQTSGVTLTGNSSMVGPVGLDDLLNSTGGNININNPALQIGVTPGTETGPTMLPGMTVTGTRINVNPSTVNVTPGSTGGNVTTEGGTLPAVTVTTSNPNVTTTTTTTSRFTGTDMLNELIRRQTPTVLPPYTVTTSSNTATNVTTQVNPNTRIDLSGFNNRPFVGPIPYTGTATSTTTSTTTSTATSTTTNVRTDTGTTSNVGTIATNTSVSSITGTQGRNYRDFGLELGETTAALRAKQADLLNMYGGIYQNFLNQTAIPQAATSSLADLAASQAKLDRIRAGQLSPEDIRNSQQAAREAYAARGQVMGPGAISSEILNRENIRQQREDQARAAYQSAMGNVLNTANLQTGNIFQPIGSLISGTFNPLSPYAADVYGTNVNAQLARDIAQQNNLAAVQAAQFGANATRSAANTQAGTQIGIAAAKWFLSCMPGEQTIDTPTGPVAVENLRGGDYVMGPDNFPVRVMQVSSYVQDPTRLFIRFTLDNGDQITVCDLHKIMGIPAIEWTAGSKMGARTVTAAEPVYGINRSYDLLTEVGGYQIHGVSVNSMIPEMIELAAQLVA